MQRCRQTQRCRALRTRSGCRAPRGSAHRARPPRPRHCEGSRAKTSRRNEIEEPLKTPSIRGRSKFLHHFVGANPGRLLRCAQRKEVLMRPQCLFRRSRSVGDWLNRFGLRQFASSGSTTSAATSAASNTTAAATTTAQATTATTPSDSAQLPSLIPTPANSQTTKGPDNIPDNGIHMHFQVNGSPERRARWTPTRPRSKARAGL